MSDSSDDGEPFRLRDYSEDSDDERPSKRRKKTGQPALRAKGLGFVQAASQIEEDEEDEDAEDEPEDERPSMGMGFGMQGGNFGGAFSIGEYNGQREEKSTTPELDSGAQTPSASGRGPSAFGANGRVQKNSFAARMMAKMGHVEGQGLGKSNQGIAAPIQAQLLQSRAGLGHGTAPEKPKKTKQEKSKTSQASTPGASTPRRKAYPKAKYAVAAIESRGLQIPEAMKSIIVDATGIETRTLSSLSGFSTPTGETPPPSEAAKASARIKMQLQAYADAWDVTKEHEARLDQEDEQLQAAVSLHNIESQRYQEVISSFERVTMDDSGEARTWDQVVQRLQNLQERFADHIEDLDLSEIASACLEMPFRRELTEWIPLSDPVKFIDALASLGAILELEKVAMSRHRRRATPFESLLSLHWYPLVRSSLKDWSVYDPDKAVDLITSWQQILPPWLVYKVLDEIILPKLIEATRRFPKVVDHNAITNGSSSSRSRKAPALHSWLFDWWSIICSDDLSLERFPELRSLVKSKVDSESWSVWKPLLGSKKVAPPKKVIPASSLSQAPITVAAEEMSFKDVVDEWCSENNLLMRSTGKSDAFGRLLYRLQNGEKPCKGILIYLQGDIVFGEDGEPYALDESLIQKANKR